MIPLNPFSKYVALLRMGKHSDDKEDIDSVGFISLSYGAERKFRIRDKTNKIVQDIFTKNNYLIQMAGNFQKEFTHEIYTWNSNRKKR